MSLGWLSLLLLVFLVGSGFFSGMETGIVSINRVRLRHLLKRKDKQAIQLETFLQDSDRMLATTLIGTNICNNALTILGSGLAVRLLAGNVQLATTLSSIGLSLMILVFGEYLPKAWFQSHPLPRSGRFVSVLHFFASMFSIIAVPVTVLVRAMIPDDPDQRGKNQDLLTRRDMQYLLSHESGATPALNSRERRMVSGVFHLAEKQAKDVMLPREDRIVLKQTATMSEVLELAGRSSVKSFPVYADQEQRFTGVLKISELYEHLGDASFDWCRVLRPPQYVSDRLPADDLLPRLRFSRQPMLLIRDDQNEVVGCVTTEVVLEEIVGPLYEE